MNTPGHPTAYQILLAQIKMCTRQGGENQRELSRILAPLSSGVLCHQQKRIAVSGCCGCMVMIGNEWICFVGVTTLFILEKKLSFSCSQDFL
eukprot:g9026.t1